jgi:hypothetical protein
MKAMKIVCAFVCICVCLCVCVWVCVFVFPVLMCENGIRFDRETFVNVLSLSFVQSLKLLHNTLSPNQELLGLVKLL